MFLDLLGLEVVWDPTVPAGVKNLVITSAVGGDLIKSIEKGLAQRRANKQTCDVLVRTNPFALLIQQNGAGNPFPDADDAVKELTKPGGIYSKLEFGRTRSPDAADSLALSIAKVSTVFHLSGDVWWKTPDSDRTRIITAVGTNSPEGKQLGYRLTIRKRGVADLEDAGTVVHELSHVLHNFLLGQPDTSEDDEFNDQNRFWEEKGIK